mmetsp:Transcript_3081/g.5430  ORF Transcript_3081/g.5430 Transcript_3081/m.5430 type:complete len:227 (-) Transcript_3081:286-966(-)
MRILLLTARLVTVMHIYSAPFQNMNATAKQTIRHAKALWLDFLAVFAILSNAFPSLALGSADSVAADGTANTVEDASMSLGNASVVEKPLILPAGKLLGFINDPVMDGDSEGFFEVSLVGISVGPMVVGLAEGNLEGGLLGSLIGLDVGFVVGSFVGSVVGSWVGLFDGDAVGNLVPSTLYVPKREGLECSAEALVSSSTVGRRETKNGGRAISPSFIDFIMHALN